MAVKRICFDKGNGFWKWLLNNGRFGAVRHAIAPLTENDWEAVTVRGLPPITNAGGYLRVNGSPYAFGDFARRHIISDRARGASRYTPQYYGVALAFIMALAFDDSQKETNVDLVASYAPRDVAYAKDLRASAKRRWRVDLGDKTLTFNVNSVTTLDEPLAGFGNVAFTENGDERRNNPVAVGSTLTIDTGTYTVDTVAVDEGGLVDLSSLRSTVTGAQEALDSFERELRANNRLLFRDARDLDPRLVERAMLTGVFEAGTKEIDCSMEAKASINKLTNQVLDIIAGQGGYINYHQILLTGGGSMLIHEALKTALPNARIILADAPGEMIYANVKGLSKIAKVLDKEGN